MTRLPLPTPEDWAEFELWAAEVDRTSPPRPCPNNEPRDVWMVKDEALRLHHVAAQREAPELVQGVLRWAREQSAAAERRAPPPAPLAPPAPRVRQHHPTPPRTTYTPEQGHCAHCAAPFMKADPRALYCTPRCAKRAEHARRKLRLANPHTPAPPTPNARHARLSEPHGMVGPHPAASGSPRPVT
jgi:hypothetical protein